MLKLRKSYLEIKKFKRHVRIFYEYVKENLHLNWNWKLLSENPNIPWDFVKQNLHLPWDYFRFSKNKNLNMDFFENYFSGKLWSINLLSKNKNLNLDFVINHPEIKWNYEDINKNIIFTSKLYHKFNWDISKLSDNPSVPWNFILNNINLPWKWRHIRYNPNVDKFWVSDLIKFKEFSFLHYMSLNFNVEPPVTSFHAPVVVSAVQAVPV